MSAIQRINEFRHSGTAVVAVVSLALFVDMVVYGVVIPTLPKLVNDKLKLDASFSGILFSCYALGLLLVTPIVGVLSDRYNSRKLPMLLGLFGLAIATIMFGYGQTYYDLVIARMGQGISGGISWTIGLCMIADIFPSSQLGSVMATTLSANTIGFLVGPPIGGLLFDYFGQEAPYLFCAGLAVLDLIGRLLIDTEPLVNQSTSQYSEMIPHEEEQVYTSVHDISDSPDTIDLPEHQKASMTTLITDSQVLVTCFSILIGASVFSGIEPTFPIYVSHKYGLDPSQIGMLYTAILIPNIIVTMICGPISDKHGRKNVCFFGILIFAIACPLIALASTITELILALMLFGCGNGVLITPALPEMADFVERMGGGANASVYALFNIAYSGGMLFGPIIGGILVDSMGFQVQMYAFGAFLLAYSPVVWWFWLKQKNST